MEALYLGNSQLVRVLDLKNEVDGVLVEDAVITATITDVAGASVSGESWPISLTAIPGQSGSYQGLVSSSVSLVAGDEYRAVIDVDGGGGLVGKWNIPCKAVWRES